MTPAKQAATYVALVTLLSSPVWWYIAHRPAMQGPFVIALMWCPAAAGVLCTRIFRKPFRSLGWRWGGWRFAAIGYFLPLIYGGIAYPIIWSLGLGHFPKMDMPLLLASKLHLTGLSNTQLILLAAVIICVLWELTGGVVTATGEELGWRGFLTPTLNERYGWRMSSLITGLVWGIWHYPMFLFSTYHSAAPIGYSLVCFTCMTVALSFILTWLRLRSGSVWPCALLHASHNCWVQAFFTLLTVSTVQSKWWIDNFGAMVPIVTAIFAAVLVLKVGPVIQGRPDPA
jgi:membrane protease YdiL (CAAX protease family)